MHITWLDAWSLVVLAATAQFALISWQLWENRRFVRSRLHNTRPPNSQARVALFAPCKGLDPGLEHNLRPLFEQDHPNYELTFIVEAADDPVCEPIRGLMAEYPSVMSRLVVSGPATDTGQKVHNLRVATANLPADCEVLAFVDSDARPRGDWLRWLAGRLGRPGVGAVTGYRWFLPTRRTAAQCLLYSINGSVASCFGPGGHHLIWGGSWAIRRDVFERTGLRDAWHGTLSDDLVATRLLHRERLAVEFEPVCMVASPLEGGWRQALEFIRRQYVVARCYAPVWWLLAFIAATLGVVTFWGGLLALAIGASRGASWSWLPAAVCVLAYGASLVRGWQRRELAILYLPRHRALLERLTWLDLWTGPLVALANWLCIMSSLAGTRLSWRGIQYRIGRNGRVIDVAHGRAAGPTPVAAANRNRRIDRPEHGVHTPVQPSSRICSASEGSGFSVQTLEPHAPEFRV